MSLARIEWQQLRNLETGRWQPGPGLNLIQGENGSGKSSLLECVYLLGRARSFQTTRVHQVIRHDQAEAQVSGVVVDRPGFRHTLGIRVKRGERELLLNGIRPASSVELLKTFPVLVITPNSTALLGEGPKRRRQFLDFGVFHHHADFLDTWRRYMKVLGHRNRLLREKRIRELSPWDQELDRYGTVVMQAREQYAERLQPLFKATVQRFLPGLNRLELKTSAGWPGQKSLHQVLQDEIQTDMRQGYTQSGPHRGDFSLHVEGRSARSYLSRGQTKLLVYALLLAQSRLMEHTDSPYPGCLLIDDLASELDERNRYRLLDFLAEQPTQCFITSVDTTGFTRHISERICLNQGRIRTDIIQSSQENT